uniref:NAD(P)H-quinone oxidoreductase subunit 5, chloroplastic n=5 Tax=C4 Cyperus incertae sedis TaxID=2034351 RepID=A0A7S9EYN0_9POAL|nr:NADH-plastoquinone oxidoreductase subunit 5 [Cyperus exaltatus]YP_010045893.1 NADH-plastoquinone oxidoreductase subunit 5 [Cyperus iria]QPG24678.1 NADH-plastoquinone oxidoreductase subunit 5 [Cyperus exaltatus]QPG24768.1 NADH-plastoquinone oxidoreductase subunit 5 [Cyperus iria]
MELIYQYAWIIPFLSLIVPIIIGIGLLLISTATKSIRRIWAFPSIFFLIITLIFSLNLSIQQINGNLIYQYLWSWTINKDFSLEFGYLIDPLTSIMLILITTVGITVLIYSDSYMSHDQGYVRFFAYLNFFNASMLGLVTSSNLIQIYIFWEIVGIFSYLLIGFWFTRPLAANACQKAFITNRIGDFGLLLGILGFYWIIGSFEFRDLFEITNNFIQKNEVNSLFTTLCTFLLFLGAIAKSAQFPLHIWLPDAMEGPTPISALIHAATMVAAGVFLVARLFPLFLITPYILDIISSIGLITLFLGATLALAQKDIKRSLAYSTMSQLGYIIMALGIGSFRAALFHLITHAYSKALLFLGSGSIIHSMEPVVGYSPDKNQNMVFMGGLTNYIPITKTAFLLGTLSLCGIPPLACFWSKDEILSNSWSHSPIYGIIAYFTAGLTAFYMFRVYLLTFDGYLRINFQGYSSTKTNFFYSISLWGKSTCNKSNTNRSLPLSKINKKVSFFSKEKKKSLRNKIYCFNIFEANKYTSLFPHESDNTMLIPLLLLIVFTVFIGLIGINFDGSGLDLDLLSRWLTLSKNSFIESSNQYVIFYEFLQNVILSVSIATFGLCIAFIFYGSINSFFPNLFLINLFFKKGVKRDFLDQIQNAIYNWSYNRGYIDILYNNVFILGIRKLSKFTEFFDKHIIDGIPNGIGVTSFFIGEGVRFIGNGRVSFYLFFFLSFVSLFLLIFLFF